MNEMAHHQAIQKQCRQDRLELASFFRQLRRMGFLTEARLLWLGGREFDRQIKFKMN